MNDKPSQAFLDSEIGRAIRGLTNLVEQEIINQNQNIIDGPDRLSAASIERLATIERLLAAERRKVAEGCIEIADPFIGECFDCSSARKISEAIDARFPAPKEDA